MNLNRGDMKLLTECGYSGVLRNLDVDLAPIFRALDEWMPDQGAGPIGLAIQDMVAGRLDAAAERLTASIESGRKGVAEARAMLALVRALQKDHAGAEALAAQLDGQGGAAESFATLLMRSEAHKTPGASRPAKTAAS